MKNMDEALDFIFGITDSLVQLSIKEDDFEKKKILLDNINRLEEVRTLMYKVKNEINANIS